MKKLYLTSLLVLFTLPAMANASDPFATATNYGQIEDIFKTQAKKILNENGGMDNSEKSILEKAIDENIEALQQQIADNTENNTPTEDINEATEEKTETLTEAQKQANAQKLADLKSAADQAGETEKSFENRMLGAAGIGATGLGAMQLASGLAEQKADEDAETAMLAYLATFTCEYGSGRISGGSQNNELPGSNVLTPLVIEYKTLASDLKARKEALGLKPGIESEVVLDSATAGLHNDKNVGKTGGAYTSLARALSGNAEDAAAWDAQKAESAEKVKKGAITAGIGAAGSALGNMALNSDKLDGVKNAANGTIIGSTKPDLTYKQVCDYGKSEGEDYCYSDTFTKIEIGPKQTDEMAILAQGLILYNDKEEATCDTKDIYKKGDYAYIKCTSNDNETNYEVKFKTKSSKAMTNKLDLVCAIFSGTMEDNNICTEITDIDTCNIANDVLKKLGDSATFNDNKCEFKK